jgi:hypothetical protein
MSAATMIAVLNLFEANMAVFLLLLDAQSASMFRR